jgi:hypothetical protein
MGYYIDFELEIQNVDKVENLGESVAELCPDLVDSIQYNGGIAEDEVKSGFVVFNSKWNERENELIALSERYPELNITLYCDGEDNERWVEYYKNGEMEIGIATLVYSKTTLW